MIDFDHKPDLILAHAEIKNNCLARVRQLNRQKNQVLEDFIREIEEKKGSNWDLENEFNTRIMPQMASFGGKISGQTRLVKSELAKYVLQVLVYRNENYFKQFTTMNFIVFSQFFLETSPTKKSILPLIDNSIDWKTKNFSNPNFARKENFREYLSNLEIDKSGFKWFFDEYEIYRQQVQLDSQISRENLKLIKDSIK